MKTNTKSKRIGSKSVVPESPYNIHFCATSTAPTMRWFRHGTHPSETTLQQAVRCDECGKWHWINIPWVVGYLS